MCLLYVGIDKNQWKERGKEKDASRMVGGNKIGFWLAFDKMVHEKFVTVTLMDRQISMWWF